MEIVKVPKDILMDEVRKILSNGSQVRLRAQGGSMRPYISDGRDLLVLSPTKSQELKLGDSVLALTDQGQYVMHRIIAICQDKVTLRGDGNLYGTETCSIDNVMGVLVGLERDGKYIYVNSRTQRLKAWVMRRTFRFIHKSKYRICALLKVLR